MTRTIISIEGSIGAGKSKLLEYLKSNVKCVNDRPIIFLDEPVPTWSMIRDKDGENILQRFYQDKSKYSFAFQILVLQSLMEQIKSCPANCVIICERSVFSSKKVFFEMLCNDGIINDIEKAIYERVFHDYTYNFHIDHFVYLRTPAAICAERIQERARSGEECIPLAYLMQVEAYTDRWLLPDFPLVLDGSVNWTVNPPDNWLQQIYNLIDN